MRHGSLFSGIGGFDLASQWMGWENVFHCEWMEFPRKVLHYYWPEAVSYDDITKTDFSIHRGGIDILTGGFPCQPYSAAGKRQGKDDDRHLWPHMLRAIREIRPRWVVGENVFGLLTWNDGLVFEEVCADLEAEGYAVQAFVIPACAVNAPHRRDRVWFVAHAQSIGFSARQQRSQRGWAECQQQGREIWRGFTTISQAWSTTYTSGIELQRSVIEGGIGGAWPLEGQRGQSIGSFCGTWEEFPTVTPICGADDGIPRGLDGITFSKWRAESIKGYGNAIVPQVALQIFRAIEAQELLKEEP